MVERVYLQPFALHDAVQQRVRLHAYRVRGIAARHRLVVLQQRRFGVLAAQILIEFAAQCCCQHLYASADAQNGNLLFAGQPYQHQFGFVSLRADASQLRHRLLAHEQRVQVSASRQQQAVYVLQHLSGRRLVFDGRYHQRYSACAEHRAPVSLGQLTAFLAIVARNADYREFIVHSL